MAQCKEESYRDYNQSLVVYAACITARITGMHSNFEISAWLSQLYNLPVLSKLCRQAFA